MRTNKKSVLLIEDESELAGLMKERIDDEGFRCVVSGSRVEMLMKMRNQEFDLVICDLNIRGSAGGDTIYNVIKTVEAFKVKPPIIVCSGNIDMDIMKEYASEINAAFVKPVNMDLLLQRIVKLCA